MWALLLILLAGSITVAILLGIASRLVIGARRSFLDWKYDRRSRVRVKARVLVVGVVWTDSHGTSVISGWTFDPAQANHKAEVGLDGTVLYGGHTISELREIISRRVEWEPLVRG